MNELNLNLSPNCSELKELWNSVQTWSPYEVMKLGDLLLYIYTVSQKIPDPCDIFK